MSDSTQLDILGQLAKRSHPRWSSACALDDQGRKIAFADRGSCPVDTADGLLAIDEATMSAGFVISTARRDQHGDVVVPHGCVGTLQDYYNNPQVFFSHRSDEYPVALAKHPLTGQPAVWVSEDQIISRGYFHGKTRESTETFDLVASGILRAASIGFTPIRIEVMDLPYPQVTPGEPFLTNDMKGLIFHEWSLLEWSIVPVPANPDALRGHLDKGKVKSVMLRKSLEYAAAKPKGHLFIDAKGALLDDLVAPPHQGNQKPEPAVDSSGRPQQGDKAEQPQAAIFSLSRYETADQVKAWLEENDLKADSIERVTSDDGPGDWVAVQFKAALCDPESVRKQQVEDGVTLVFCKLLEKKDEPKPEDQKVMADVIEKELDTPVPGNQQVAGMEPAIISPSPGVKAEEPPDNRPHGCKMMHTVKSHLCAITDYIKDAAPMLEHPKVAKMIMKIHDHAHQLHADIHELGQELYPDHFPGAAPDVPAGSKAFSELLIKKGVAPDEFEVADVAFLLTELSGVKELSASQRIACARVGEQLSGYRVFVNHEAKSTPPAPVHVPVTQEPVTVLLSKSAEDEQVEKLLQEKLETLTRKLYELTGEEI